MGRVRAGLLGGVPFLRIGQLVDLGQIIAVQVSVLVGDRGRDDGALRARLLLLLLIARLRVLRVQHLREIANIVLLLCHLIVCEVADQIRV